MKFFFYAALATARFDGTSHILPAHINLTAAGAPAPAQTRAAEQVLDYLLK
jgi:hypothetical protein